MIDDTLKVKKTSKRAMPFPVKMKQNANKLKACLEQGSQCSTLMMHGGRDFELRVARTESMSSAASVKNIMNALVKTASLIIHAQTSKDNYVLEAYLSTSKSKPLPII